MYKIKKKTPRKFLFAVIKAQQEQLNKFTTLLSFAQKERDTLKKLCWVGRLYGMLIRLRNKLKTA